MTGQKENDPVLQMEWTHSPLRSFRLGVPNGTYFHLLRTKYTTLLSRTLNHFSVTYLHFSMQTWLFLGSTRNISIKASVTFLRPPVEYLKLSHYLFLTFFPIIILYDPTIMRYTNNASSKNSLNAPHISIAHPSIMWKLRSSFWTACKNVVWILL